MVYRQINFYRKKDGSCPIEIFLDSLPGKVAQKIVWVLQLIEEREIVSSNYFKKLKNTDNIWECRIKLGSNIYRIFCFFSDNSNIILTHGFVKKTMKTPSNQIEKAENYKNDFFSRKK